MDEFHVNYLKKILENPRKIPREVPGEIFDRIVKRIRDGISGTVLGGMFPRAIPGVLSRRIPDDFFWRNP